MKPKIPACLAGGALLIACAGDVWASATDGVALSIVPLPDNSMLLACAGLPGQTFSLQAATDLAAPVWVTIGTTNADASGLFNFIDRDFQHNFCRFYRTTSPGAPTKKASGGGWGLTAKGQILLSGGASFDSFDSSFGPYDPADPGTNAVAVSNSKTAGAVHLSGGKICGLAITGPGGTVTTSGSASVGDVQWIASGKTGVQPGHSTNDADVQFNYLLVPSSSGLPPRSGTVGCTNYTYVVNGNVSANWYAKNLTISGGQSMIITGKAQLYVPGDFTTSGSGFIYLAPGASLRLYVGGKFVVSGDGIVNGTGLAKNLSVYGLNSCTTATYSGSAAFIGTVYAPYASFTFSGGAGAYGAFTANMITISGSGGVHYDESLNGL